MSSRRIKGALHNFLGTFISRYSNHKGYWLFGFLTNEPEEVRIILHPWDNDMDEGLSRRMKGVARMARKKFEQQCQKADACYLKEADLLITRHPESGTCDVNGRPRPCFRFTIEVRATCREGRKYSQKRFVLAAPHDPFLEFRSTKRGRLWRDSWKDWLPWNW